MSDDLAAAYELIYAFKAGHFQAEAPVSERHQRLVHLLAEDLGLATEVQSFREAVRSVAAADSSWNKQTQALVSEYYALCEQGRTADANTIRAQFLTSCPSAWYRGIVEAL